MSTITTTTKKPTLATVKSFLRKNEGNILVNVSSKFDGMVDGSVFVKDGFMPAIKHEDCKYRLGIQQAWFVGQSRDYITRYEAGEYVGFEVYNSCRTFVLAVKKSLLNG